MQGENQNGTGRWPSSRQAKGHDASQGALCDVPSAFGELGALVAGGQHGAHYAGEIWCRVFSARTLHGSTKHTRGASAATAPPVLPGR